MANKDPFALLGLDRNTCTQADVEEAYIKLRDKYREERFEEGEKGTNAARMLDSLEVAYKDAIDYLRNSYTVSGGSSAYDNVESSIRSGNLDEAQTLLDSIPERGARWHYLQATVFYKKGWLLESRKQLQLAINLDPDNTKYSDTLNRLDDELKSKNPFSSPEDEAKKQQQRSYSEPHVANSGSGMNACNCCSSLLCADCCCECMGGDLIACC